MYGSDGEIPGDVAQAGDDRRRLRRRRGWAAAWPGRGIGSGSQDRGAAAARGVGGHRVPGGVPGMEHRPGAGGGRDRGRDRRRAAGNRPGGWAGPYCCSATGVATGLGYDIDAALEEPKGHDNSRRSSKASQLRGREEAKM